MCSVKSVLFSVLDCFSRYCSVFEKKITRKDMTVNGRHWPSLFYFIENGRLT